MNQRERERESGEIDFTCSSTATITTGLEPLTLIPKPVDLRGSVTLFGHVQDFLAEKKESGPRAWKGSEIGPAPLVQIRSGGEIVKL